MDVGVDEPVGVADGVGLEFVGVLVTVGVLVGVDVLVAVPVAVVVAVFVDVAVGDHKLGSHWIAPAGAPATEFSLVLASLCAFAPGAPDRSQAFIDCRISARAKILVKARLSRFPSCRI